MAESRKPKADLEAVRQTRHAAVIAGLQVGNFAPVAPSLPLRADLLRICHRGRRTLRRCTRRMDGLQPDPSLSSVGAKRLRSGEDAGGKEFLEGARHGVRAKNLKR